MALALACQWLVKEGYIGRMPIKHYVAGVSAGIVVAIAQELQVPVKFVGVGEGINDLKPFAAKEFPADLF